MHSAKEVAKRLDLAIWMHAFDRYALAAQVTWAISIRGRDDAQEHCDGCREQCDQQRTDASLGRLVRRAAKVRYLFVVEMSRL